MNVSQMMTHDVRCIAPDATLQEAAEWMKELDCGSLPVCENDRLAGMITDRDIVVRSASAGHDPLSDVVRDVMTPRVIYCFDDQDVSEAAEIMKANQIRRLPVLNRSMRLVGIIALGDLAIESGDEQLAGETLERISEPATPVGAI